MKVFFNIFFAFVRKLGTFLIGYNIFVFKLFHCSFDLYRFLIIILFNMFVLFVRICILKWQVFNIFTTHWWFSASFIHTWKKTFMQGLMFEESFANILYITVSELFSTHLRYSINRLQPAF